MPKFLKNLIKIGFVFVIVVLLLCTVLNLLVRPSNNRDWNDDQAILPFAEINGSLISIHNIRNFTYASTTSYTKNYYNKTFDIRNLKKVWYIVEPFSGIPGSAHTFLSFEFNSPQNLKPEFVSISVEIRKEKGESFNPIKGLLNQYEIMYVIADEKDVIKLRSNYRKDMVYLYPIKTSDDSARGLFLGMINRTNYLSVHPEFYNTLTNTCTTNIVRHVDKISPKKVSLFNWSVIFPENSDRLAYDLGLIDTSLSFEQARERYFINERAVKYADSDDFSLRIRGEE